MVFGANCLVGIESYKVLTLKHKVTPCVDTVESKERFLGLIGKETDHDVRTSVAVADVKASQRCRKAIALAAPDVVIYCIGSYPYPDHPQDPKFWTELISDGFESLSTTVDLLPARPRPTFIVIGSTTSDLLADNSGKIRPPFWSMIESFANAHHHLQKRIGELRCKSKDPNERRIIHHLRIPALLVGSSFYKHISAGVRSGSKCTTVKAILAELTLICNHYQSLTESEDIDVADRNCKDTTINSAEVAVLA